jgi:hypothetical protein
MKTSSTWLGTIHVRSASLLNGNCVVSLSTFKLEIADGTKALITQQKTHLSTYV